MANTIAIQVITAKLKQHKIISYPFAAEAEVNQVPNCRVIRMTYRFLLVSTTAPEFKDIPDDAVVSYGKEIGLDYK